MTAEDCWLYKKEANVEAVKTGVDDNGLQWGDIFCENFEECTVSAESSCQNKIMSEFIFVFYSGARRYASSKKGV